MHKEFAVFIFLIILLFIWVAIFGEYAGTAFIIAIVLVILGIVVSCIVATANRNEEERRRNEEAEAEERRRKEEMEAEAKELQKLKNLCGTYLNRFVAAHRNNTTVWPLKPYAFEISEESKKAFLTILQEEGIAIEYNFLNKLLKPEMVEQAQEHFNQSFARLYPNLDPNGAIGAWAKAYVDVFGNNMDYYYDFLEMAKSKGRESYGFQLYSAINEEIGNRAHERQVSELKKVLKSERSLTNKITVTDVDFMSGIEFDNFLRTLFSTMGYKVEITKNSGDQGADLVIEKFGEKSIIQAKCYSAKVGNDAIQEVLGAKSYYNANRAMVVTNNYFTDAAKKLATANQIELWDRDKLSEAIKAYI
jgi:HJR/Mrr/RecB family endonuclease